MNPRDVIDGTELGADGVLALAQRALDLRAGAAPLRFPGKRVISVFLNPSLRTRTSLEAAAQNLGMHSVVLHPGSDAWKMEHRVGAVMDADATEHMADGVPALEEYGDALAVRAFAKLEDREEDRRDPVISAFRRYAKRPIVNLESALWHPLQSFADAATWMAHLGPDLRGRKLALTWAPHPKALPMAVPNQVLLTAALVGMDVTVAHPEGMDLDPSIVDRASTLAAESGGGVRVVHEQTLDGAEVVVAKSWSGWSGYGRRDEEARARAALRSWTVTAAKLPPNAGLMHCLPVRRNVEVDDEALDGPRSWTTETAGLRLWTAMACLEAVMGERSWTA